MAQHVSAAAAALLAMCALALDGCGEPQRGVDPQAAGAARDAREAITLSRTERDLVLGEMRLMLESTEGVVAGLAANDMVAIEQAAARSSPSAPGTVDRALHGVLPEAFLHSGAAAHGGFADIARLARGSFTAGVWHRRRTAQELAHAKIHQQHDGITRPGVPRHRIWRLDDKGRGRRAVRS